MKKIRVKSSTNKTELHDGFILFEDNKDTKLAFTIPTYPDDCLCISFVKKDGPFYEYVGEFINLGNITVKEFLKSEIGSNAMVKFVFERMMFNVFEKGS